MKNTKKVHCTAPAEERKISLSQPERHRSHSRRGYSRRTCNRTLRRIKKLSPQTHTTAQNAGCMRLQIGTLFSSAPIHWRFASPTARSAALIYLVVDKNVHTKTYATHNRETIRRANLTSSDQSSDHVRCAVDAVSGSPTSPPLSNRFRLKHRQHKLHKLLGSYWLA